MSVHGGTAVAPMRYCSSDARTEQGTVKKRRGVPFGQQTCAGRARQTIIAKPPFDIVTRFFYWSIAMESPMLLVVLRRYVGFCII